MNRRDILAVPEKTGIYLFKDKRGEVLYVGKAKNLRARLKSYLRPGSDSRHRVVYLMQETLDFEFFVTSSEREALLLENNMIKKHRPPYNVSFRDDKDYLCVRIDVNETFPRFELVRKVAKDGALYFGPYSSSKKIRFLLGISGKLFPMRTCTDACFKNQRKPCMQYQIKRCPAPCVGLITREDYMKNVDGALIFLRGEFKSVQRDLKKKMRVYSQELMFEKAAEIRDTLKVIEELSTTQSVVNAALPDADIFGIYREGDRGAVAIVILRNCKVIDIRSFMLNAKDVPDQELLSSLLAQYYGEGSYLPLEIVVPFKADEKFLGKYFRDEMAVRADIKIPLRGKRRDLLKFAAENAKEYYVTRRKRELQHDELMGVMREILHLKNTPVRVECYDVSHHGGKSPVGSLVVFEYGVPLKDYYRKFKIKADSGMDDYLMISEIVERRLKRGKGFGRLPDLIIIDGGKGHLSAGMKVLKGLAQDIDVISVAKERERRSERNGDRIYLPGRKNPLNLKPNDPVLHFIKRVRDEAHRFAVTYHRSRYGRGKMKSLMLNFPGIGKVRAEKLLMNYGSLDAVIEIPPDEIACLLKITTTRAEDFLTYLKKEYSEKIF